MLLKINKKLDTKKNKETDDTNKEDELSLAPVLFGPLNSSLKYITLGGAFSLHLIMQSLPLQCL